MSETFTVTLQKIHRQPDVILYHDIITPSECQHLIDMAEPYLGRSITFGGGKTDHRRTSNSTFCNKFARDNVLRKVMRRISMLSGYPRSHVEMPQIVRYEPGQEFQSHSDCYPHSSASYQKSGQRDFTFFLYLNEPLTDEQTGGETEFHGIDLKVRPKQGTAVFWRNINIATGEDEEYRYIKHRGLPPNNWTKYGMNIWVRHKPWS